MALSVVILAAGQGRRMQSSLPKPLHLLAGKPMLMHVLEAVDQLGTDEVFVVYSNGLEAYENACKNSGFDNNISFIYQEKQLGTGHAVHQVLPHVNPGNQVLVLFADVPLLPISLLQELVNTQRHDTVSVVTTELDDPSGFGRIVRDQNRQIVSIVEHKDSSDLELAINEINTGIMRLPEPYLSKWLPQLTNENAQGEYYLTDVVALAVAEGIAVEGLVAEDSQSVLGVNDRTQLAQMERYYQLSLAEDLLNQGISLADPHRFDCRGDVEIGKDVFIDVGVILEGTNKVGDGCHIGPHVVMKNVTLGDNVRIEAFSLLDGAVVGNRSIVGPYARLRPYSHLGEDVKVGNFVEIKKSTLAAGVKANHLSYIGDAQVGAGSNIGAGTITCNYDGKNKHITEIGKGVFVGSNSSFVAPVSIGEGATVAAGSVITDNVPANTLAIARNRQQLVADWQAKVSERVPLEQEEST